MRESDIAQSARDVLSRGEGATVEFKSSFRWDFRTAKVNKEMTRVVVRTLAAFLNSHGGTLLLGVNDDGDVVGIDEDLATLGKKNSDGYQLTLRSAIKEYLGPEIDPHIAISFVTLDEKTIALVMCEPHHIPVYVHDGDRRDLCVRSGNLTRVLDSAATVAYVDSHWKQDSAFTEDQLRTVIAEVLAGRLAPTIPTLERHEQIPHWLNLSTRRVLDLFLSNLSRSHGWKRIDIVSPWIQEIGGPLATLTFNQMLRRLQDDGTTVYVVTRPPEEEWHHRAIRRLVDSGRANIALLPELHVKLFTAQTVQSSFAMLGSANFTTKSLINREIGVLVSASGDGAALFRELHYEAAQIYRHPDRELLCQARL
jgi:hypothetical protein